MNNLISDIQKYDLLSKASPQTIAALLLSHLFVCKEIFSPVTLVNFKSSSPQEIFSEYCFFYRKSLVQAFCLNNFSFISESKVLRLFLEQLEKDPDIHQYSDIKEVLVNSLKYNYRNFYNISQNTQNNTYKKELEAEFSKSFQNKLPALFENHKVPFTFNYQNETKADMIAQITNYFKTHHLKFHKNKSFHENDIKRCLNNKCLQLCFIFIKNYHKSALSYPDIYNELGIPYYLNSEKSNINTKVRKNYIPTLNWFLSPIEIKNLLEFAFKKE